MANRRGHGEGLIHKRKDGRWEARIDLGFDLEGKRRRKSVYGRTRREVGAQLTQLLSDKQKGLPIPVNDRLTLQQFMDHWLTEVARPNLRASTFATYESHTRNHILPALGHTALQHLTPQEVQTFVNYKLEKGLAPRTVADMHAVLRTALAQALKWNLVARNVAALVDSPRIPKKQLNYLTPEQARQFMDSIKGSRWECLYITAISLGLRRGEALGLKWEDVDLDKAVLTVKRAAQRVDHKLQLVELKTKSAYRSINLPAFTVAALRSQYVRQLEERLLAGTRWQETGLVFTTSVGTPIEPRNYKRAFDSALEKAGLEHMRIHDMRHTAASLLLAQGVPPKVISEILGHARVSITLDIYSHLYEPMRKEAAEKMDALFDKRPDQQQQGA
jgi:integrase